MGRSRLAGRARAGVAFFASACLACIVLLAQLWGAAPAGAAVAQTPQVLTLSLKGPVDPFMASYVQRGIRTAGLIQGGNSYSAVALTLDTPGGLDSSMRDIVNAVLASRVPVLCYVPEGARAASAGTFIMFACPVNGMAPGSEIGAAHPVGVSGAIESAKVTNDDAAFLAGLARLQGRNASWATDAVVNSASVGAAAAVSLHVADYEAPTLAAFLADAGRCTAGSPSPASGAERIASYSAPACGDATTAFSMTAGERLFHTLADPNIAFVLLDIAFVALILWAFHPGLHASLAVGVVSLALGLAILETLPVRLAGFILLMVAAVLLVLDVKAKAHGILTAAGVVVLILGGLLLFNPAVPHARVSPVLLIMMPVALGVVTAFLLRAIAVAKEEPLHAGVGSLTGLVGTAESALAPRGRVHLRGESWSAESVGGTVAAGASVRVVGVTGLTLEVLEEPLGAGGAPGLGQAPASAP